MMWFFAILVVLVMGGVAAVAAGRGAPMTEAYDDRPDALVPAAGPLRPDDLRRVRFSLGFRGYRMSEVDALLDRLARQLEEVPEPAATGEIQVADTPVVPEVHGDPPPR
jgi:DivIVA domain-containing protein